MTSSLIFCAALWAAAPAAAAGLLSAQGATVLDTTLTSRPAFTDTERVVFSQRVFNGVQSTGRINYKFIVLAPNGSEVLTHQGNSVPGSVGSSASQISGIPISQFHRGPGIYTLKAQAELDGQTIEQLAQFTVSSPNVLLVYPPNGSQGVADQPLTFRWTSSGAARYRLTVGDSPSFYNSVFNQDTIGGEDFLTYPDNPPDPRQRLASGQAYYWKIEGFDAAGLKIAESPAPYSFTVAAAALTKDLAVSDLTVGAPAPDGAYPFTMTVANQGGTTEMNVPLKFSVGGLPAPGTPITLGLMGPTENRGYTVSAALPVDQTQSLAIACVEFSDNNIANNCKTLMVTKPTTSTDTGFGAAQSLSPEQIWSAIRELLRERGVDMTGYELVAIRGSLTQNELLALLEALRSGQASVSVTQPVVGVPTVTPIPGFAPPLAVGEAPALVETTDAAGEEWSGFAAPMFEATQTFVIKNESAFSRIWTRLTNAQKPDIDFKKNVLIAVVAGRKDRADRVEIEGVYKKRDADLIRYRLIVQDRFSQVDGVRRAASRTSVPYLLRAISKAKQAVEFEKIEDVDKEEKR